MGRPDGVGDGAQHFGNFVTCTLLWHRLHILEERINTLCWPQDRNFFLVSLGIDLGSVG